MMPQTMPAEAPKDAPGTGSGGAPPVTAGIDGPAMSVVDQTNAAGSAQPRSGERQPTRKRWHVLLVPPRGEPNRREARPA